METRALKMKSTVTGHQKLTKTNLDHWSWSSYNFTRSCWRTQYWPFYDHSAWSKSEKVKKLDKWGAREPTKIFLKIIILYCNLLIIHNKSEQFLNQIVMFDKKWTLYDSQQWPAQWLDWEEVPNHFPKPDLHPKMSWSQLDVLLSIWSITAFWIPEKPFHPRSMLSR